MSYLAAFHARTSLPQEKVLGLTESDQECGEKWRGSFTKYDPDSSSWKTHQCSLLGDLDEFSETWPRWGLMRDGECWEQQMSAHRTNETESGLWPTPCATDYKGSGKTGELRDRLDYAVERGATKSKTYTWPTPATKGYGHAAEGMVANLIQKIEDGIISKQEAEQMLNLPNLENHRTWKKKFPTFNSSDHIQRKTSASWAAQGRVNYVLSNPEITGVSGGKLNPTWVEWLMGWPLGWTDLKPLEMDKFQKWQEQHGRN
jgi:hypothetical protein